MIRKATHSLTLWLTIIAIFSLGFYFSSQRTQNNEVTAIMSEKSNQQMMLVNQELALKEKLASDFEIAFLKQYTQPVGCEVLKEASQTTECEQHLQHAKNQFKEVFIKDRGLPKNTFEELKLSFIE